MELGRRGLICLLVLAALAVYANSLLGGFIWDDLNNIVDNPSLEKSLDYRELFLTVKEGFYRPISELSIRFDFWLWGLRPFGFHLTNLALHILNTVLIFLILGILTKSYFVSFFSSLLFAIHPVNVEAVSYISGRSDPLAGLLILGSFYFFIKTDKNSFKYKSWLQILTLVSFVFAILSRENALVLPLALLAYRAIFTRQGFKESFRKTIPFFLVVFGYFLFRLTLTDNNLYNFSVRNISNIPKTLLFSLKLIFFPFDLHMQHAITENSVFNLIPSWLALLVLAAIAIAIFKYTKERYVFWGLLWFFVWISPFLGFFKFSADFAEHWLYLPSIGIFLLIGKSISLLKFKMRFLTSLAVIIFLSVLSINYNNVWRDDITLYKYTLKHKPKSQVLYYNLGNAYLRKGMLNEAESNYRISLKINPKDVYALNNLGVVLENKGDIGQAFSYYAEAVSLDNDSFDAKDNIERLKSLVIDYVGENLMPSSFAADNLFSFDNSLYREVLSRYLKNGWVDYRSLKNDSASLKNYLGKIAALTQKQINSMSWEDKKAFYINVYNAQTLNVVIDNYPVKSIKNISGVWDKIEFSVAGKLYTLNDIEHNILRKEFKDARIHFALVCASLGCPKLGNEPFSGLNIDEALDKEAYKFIKDESKVRLSKEKNILYISPIFKWYRKDFDDPKKFIAKYLTDDDKEFISKNNPKVKYLNYDWTLNEK